MKLALKRKQILPTRVYTRYARAVYRLFGMADDINKLKEKNMIIEAFDQCESLLRVLSKLGKKKL